MGEARVKSEGGEGKRESEARRYLRRIILHYVPKRRTNAVLIYASPRGDKRKAGEIGVSRAGNRFFLKVRAPRVSRSGYHGAMLELLRSRPRDYFPFDFYAPARLIIVGFGVGSGAVAA